MATTKKKPKKRATKATKARKAKKASSPRKATKKRPSHHLASAHASTMKALPHVTRADLDSIQRLARAVQHTELNAKGAARK